MNILIIGSGGREHALAWKLAQDKQVKQIFVAPGNAGTDTLAKCKNIALDVLQLDELANFALQNNCLTIVGHEAPLVAGIVDLFQAKNLPIFGPNAAAAQLEGSKIFAKQFLSKYQIPTAKWAQFTDVDDALNYVANSKIPLVIKADGLAAGKGVIVAQTLLEAQTAVKDMLSNNVFGSAGAKVVIEEFLSGEEASFIVMVDGKNVIPLATSQDHKRAFDNDLGPNTGGMGAYSPAPVVTADVHNKVMTQIIEPTIAGLSQEGINYVGFLYAGLMIDSNGNPYVIEFNCRLGDPETQPILMRLKSSLLDLINSALTGNLNTQQVLWSDKHALGVVLAAGGYPNSYNKGDVIGGLEQIDDLSSVIFHAGTKLQNNNVITNGGRVLCATALGNNLLDAKNNAYKLANKVKFKDMFYRQDIGFRVQVQMCKSA